MSLPEIAGHELLELIGSGGCGAVYKARAADGSDCAVKVFSSMAINRKALTAVSHALAAMPPHPGIVTPASFGFERSPYFWAQPLFGHKVKDSHGRARWETSTLEDWCQQGVAHERAWELVYELADALSWLHRHGVPHGNLRPCNILVADKASPPLRLTDMAQGWVGGIHHLDMGDHFIYLCPDQAQYPEGVFTGRGPSWDVYSFGVIAYRLLTGQLPRAEAAWERQLDLARHQVAAGLAYQIDSQALLQAVRAEPIIAWPDAAEDSWEERRRHVIERALEFDPARRWSDMREVAHEFEVLEADFLLEESRAQTEAERERQAGRVRSLKRLAAGLAAVLAVAAGLAAFTGWRWNNAERVIAGTAAAHAEALQQQKDAADGEIAQREKRIASLTRERDRALTAKQRTDLQLDHSQAAVDQFLTQLLQAPAGGTPETGFSQTQLQDALAFCTSALAELEKNPEAGPERTRMLGNIAQVRLRLRQDAEAEAALEKARQECAKLASSDAENAPRYKQWQGRYGLLLAEIKTRQGNADAAYQLLSESAPRLRDGLKADATSLARTESARAWLDLGRQAYERGDLAASNAALEQAGKTLDGSEIATADAAFIRASALFQQGLVSRLQGRTEEAMERMIDAVRTMGELVMGSSPRNQEQALALAEAYTVLAELVGQHFSGKDALDAHQQAVPILLELNRLLPEWAAVKYLLARNNGAIAQLERDLGQAAEAVRKKQDAIELINEVLADAPEHPDYLFLQARLRGEYAGFLADSGKASEAVAMAKLAVSTLDSLLEKHPVQDRKALPPSRREWEVQLAQICGIMGHASQQTGMKEAAKNAFTKAAELWTLLAESGQQDEVVKQGLAWTQDRLAKLK